MNTGTSQWYDTVRKNCDSKDEGLQLVSSFKEVSAQTADAALNHKVAQGYVAVSRPTLVKLSLVEVIESTYSPVSGAGTGAIYLEAVYQADIQKQ